MCMFQKNCLKAFILFFLCAPIFSIGQPNSIDTYNITWTSPSETAGASMPCGGGGIGANVWVEKGSLYLYLQQSGWFDENNTSLKAGRIKIDLTPNPLAGSFFIQSLHVMKILDREFTTCTT